MARRRRYPPSGPRDNSLVLEAGYTDVLGTVDQAAAVAALTYETYRDTPLSLYWMRHDQNDAVSLRFQGPHGWDRSAVEPHVHVIGASPSDGVVVLDGYITWSAVSSGLVVGALSSWTPFRVTKTITAAEQWTETAISLGIFTPPALAQQNSGNIWVYMRRPGAADAADTYQGSKPTGTAAANLGIVFFDCHMKLNRIGSTTYYTG